MKKLPTHKPWLTLPEAARHLSTTLGSDVSEADILRLALDGKLKLSVHAVDGISARRWDKRENLLGEKEPYMSIHLRVEGKEQVFFPTKETVEFIPDIALDLLMVGSERSVVLQYHQQLRGFPDSLIGVAALAGEMGGWFFVTPNGDVYQPESHCNDANAEWMHPRYFSWMPLTGDYPFVVRMSAIEELIALSGTEPVHRSLVPEANKPIGRRTAQDQEVLDTIVRMGLDPEKLPPSGNGARTIKKDIEMAVEDSRPDLFVRGSSVFEKAWGRLLKDGRVAWASKS